MSKAIFNVQKYESKRKKGNRKTGDKRKNVIIEIDDGNNENGLNENFSIEIIGEEEKSSINKNDNEHIETFMDEKKHYYPLYDNNLKSDNILSKYIININIFNYR